MRFSKLGDIVAAEMSNHVVSGFTLVKTLTPGSDMVAHAV